MTDATLYTERGLPRRSAKEKASGTIEQIQVKKLPIIEGEIRKKRAYTRRNDKDNNKRRGVNNRGKRKNSEDADEPQAKRRKIAKNSEDNDTHRNNSKVYFQFIFPIRSHPKCNINYFLKFTPPPYLFTN